MFKKILIGFFVFILLLIGAVAAVPFLFKDKINALIKEQLNKELLADLEYGDYDLSILKSFPDLYFSIEDVSIVGRDHFEGDTLASIKELGLGLELMKYIRGEELLINSVNIEEPKILAYTLLNTETGDTISNYDIMPPSGSADSQSDLIAIDVKEFNISKAKVYYKDFISGMEVVIEDLNVNAGAKYQDDIAQVVSKFTVEALSFNDGSMQYLNKTKIEADINVDADLTKNYYTLKENKIKLNDLALHADGFVELADENTTNMDLSFSADQSTFKELLSLIPAEYLIDYAGLQAEGSFALNGFAKGKLTETETPAFELNLSIQNGNVQYPDLPSSIKKINLEASVKNNSAFIENTTVNIPQATFSLADQDFIMSLFAQNIMGDPNLDLKLKGNLDLKRIPEFYPLEGVSELQGMLDADLSFKGRISDVENENYQNLDFAGELNVKDLKANTTDMPMPLSASSLSLAFSPQKADLVLENAQLGQSDFNMNGQLENLIPYLFADGVLRVKTDLKSQSLNLDELLGSESEEADEEEVSSATKVPANLDFQGKLQANQVFYDGLEMKEVLGMLSIKDESLNLTNLSANLLGGSAKINGSYTTKNTDKPVLTLAYDIQKFDIQKTFEYMNTIQAIAPMAKYLTGTFSTDMNLNSLLNNDLSLDLNALSGLGTVKIPYASFAEVPMFKKLSETLKIPAFNKPALNDAWTILKFSDGKVDVEPFQIKMQDMVLDVFGSNGFDQSINYTMKLTVPSDKFGGAATLANDFLSKQNIPLLNLTVPQSLTFHLNVTGMLSNPDVKIVKVTADKGEQGVKDQIKEVVKDQVDKAKEDIKNQAQQEVDKAKEQAQQELDKAKQQAQDEINKAKENVQQTVKDKIKGLKW